jgi:hypothetical protein
VRNLGWRGASACAISAVDVALWDLRARLLNVPLPRLLGQARDKVAIYSSGGSTSYSLRRLQEQLGQWVEQDGCAWVKMKVGALPENDVARVRAARAAIGKAGLYVDANGAYARKQALRFAHEFAQFGVCWFEEPVSSDDLEGLRLIRDRAPRGMEMAAGEYGYEPFYFRRTLQADAVDVLQADATRCGGYTGFYATDASNYRQVPIGVVIPRSSEDVVKTVEVCQRFDVPIVSRGGGTSLAGQGCNVAVLIDFSKYLNHIRSLDAGARTAEVEPGCILDNLRSAAEEQHLTFGPDPATHDHNTLGGMIGNNSCGVHSVQAGRTSDNVEALEILTYDGVHIAVGPTSDDELRQHMGSGGRRAEIFTQLDGCARADRAHMRRSTPSNRSPSAEARAPHPRALLEA